MLFFIRVASRLLRLPVHPPHPLPHRLRLGPLLRPPRARLDVVAHEPDARAVVVAGQHVVVVKGGGPHKVLDDGHRALLVRLLAHLGHEAVEGVDPWSAVEEVHQLLSDAGWVVDGATSFMIGKIISLW